MIVDLLRNDLSRVSKPDGEGALALRGGELSHRHQMTSTVVAELEDGLGPIDAIEALFPAGRSPARRESGRWEIIADTERRVRGVYTGSIGRVAPDGDASFNVAIRTLTLPAGERRAVMGLGAGIVADSRAPDEWRECLAKGAFLKGSEFDLIETMRFDPHEGIAELDRHLNRLKASADAFGFTFDRHGARNELQAATFRLREEKKVRLRLSATGPSPSRRGPCRRSRTSRWRWRSCRFRSSARISAFGTRPATAASTRRRGGRAAASR
jgi:para-aminobenzoate synthetase/4-amino-4-deoxychorismate lyase